MRIGSKTIIVFVWVLMGMLIWLKPERAEKNPIPQADELAV
jgi:hypothetical protein